MPPPIHFPDKAVHAAIAELHFQIAKEQAKRYGWDLPTRVEYADLPDSVKQSLDIPVRESVSKFLRVWL